MRPCEALAGVGAGPGWVRPGVGAGLDARPEDWEESCGACVAGGAGLGCTCMEPDVASQRPRGLRLCCLPSPLPPTRVSRCHPRTAAALRNLRSVEKEEIGPGGCLQREKGQAAPRAYVCGCGGPPGSPPPGGDVIAPHLGPPFCTCPEQRTGGGRPTGEGSPVPTLATGCSGQVASSGGAPGPSCLSQALRSPAPSSHQASPGLCSWVALLWADFQGARGLRSLLSLPGAICPGIDRKRTGCASRLTEPCLLAISSSPRSL